MSHEMAHQWFGNEVTHQYWNVVWLKEGLATLFEDLLTDAVHPEWRMWDQFVINTMQVVMQQDCALNVRHMMKPYSTPAEIRAVYDFVTYKKAGSVMRMMMHVLSPAVFQLSMDYYIEDNSYATATNVKLAAAWQKAIDETSMDLPDIATVFEHWTNSPGFPVVFVTRSYGEDYKTVSLLQQRFNSSLSTLGTETYLFHIPLNYATQKDANFTATAPTLWLTERETTFELADIAVDQWVIFNKQATGYYRVNYDYDNWVMITSALKSDHATVASANRAQLIDDALNLAMYKRLHYGVALELVSYVKEEEDFVPLTSAFMNLGELERKARGASLNLEQFYFDLIEGLYKKINLENIPATDSDVDRLARIEIVNFACKYGHVECTQSAFNTLSANATADILADFRPAIFCGAVQYLYTVSDGMVASVILYNRLAQKSSTEGDRRRNDKEINDIFNAFACVKNELVLEEVLSWTVKGREGVYFDKGDTNKIFSAVAGANVTGTAIAMEFLNKNYQQVVDKYDSMPKVYEALSKNVVTQELKASYEAIVATHVTGQIEDALKTALEAANILIWENLLWKQFAVEEINSFLRGSAGRILLSPVVGMVTLVAVVVSSLLYN